MGLEQYVCTNNYSFLSFITKRVNGSRVAHLLQKQPLASPRARHASTGLQIIPTKSRSTHLILSMQRETILIIIRHDGE